MPTIDGQFTAAELVEIRKSIVHLALQLMRQTHLPPDTRPGVEHFEVAHKAVESKILGDHFRDAT